MNKTWRPEAEGMYNPDFEHDACGMGFIANATGHKSHGLVSMGIEILECLVHRGAAGCDPETGDGAGLLIQIPDAFFRARLSEQKIDLPKPGHYAVGAFFLPPDGGDACVDIFNRICREEGVPVLAWRDVPVDREQIGWVARKSCPTFKQVFLANPELATMDFERKLYIIRRLAEKAVLEASVSGQEFFYIPSLSSRLVSYKGMMLAHQVTQFYPDLGCEEMVTALTLVHQRYSTNTFPTWPLAQPFRMMCHNGEINTLRGNINKMMSRHSQLFSDVWGKELQRVLPIVMEGNSDSSCFDNMLELLALSGRSLAHSILMMIPEVFTDDYYMSEDLRGFYEYHAMFMEPWDGPSAIAFTDGVQVGGILDRNGLRPSRYTITKDNLVILTSETGVLDIPNSDIRTKGRLQPGQMMLVDTEAKRILTNNEIKARLSRQQHYRRWVMANRIEFRGFGGIGHTKFDAETILPRQLAFGYTQEDLETLLVPMATKRIEPTGSMGNDAPLAVLSDKPQLLFNYFKQYFAQVTNPPIDPIREKLVMSLVTFLGPAGNILTETPEHARRLKLHTPILTDHDMNRIRDSRMEDFRAITLDILFPAAAGDIGLEAAMDRLAGEAEQAIADGYTIIILSDRNISTEMAAVPSLLAVSGVGHHLIRKGIRTQVGIIIESGEPREVNHFAILSSFGADAINPYLALESLAKLHDENHFGAEMSIQDVVENYIKALEKGILKILSKMGISTLRSYLGAQVYEALGLSGAFVEKYFTKTVSRIGGIGVREVANETLMRHTKGFGPRRGGMNLLDGGGIYSYQNNEERHLWTPEAMHYLQQATRQNSPAMFTKFSTLINDQENRHVTLRSLLDFDFQGVESVPLEEVEPATEITKRFATGAMSFGSLGKEAHEALAVAMNRIGGMSNSGEGGEDPVRFIPLENGDSKCSFVKQVASGRFGVTAEYLANAKEIQIKMAQGAKPGEGGHLPGYKVDREIARVRHSTPGVSLTSPPPHHDIYSIEDLAQLIFDLKNANPEARVSVKLVSEAGVGTIAAGVAKGYADMVLIAGGDGGTGASPLSSIKHAGIPWELGLSETHQTLVKNDLRGRIRVQTDGQMRTGRDVAMGILLGAEEIGFGTAALVTLGCVMMRQCHLNTCPVGVATQDPRCRSRFTGRARYVVNFMTLVAEELRGLMAKLGFRTIDEMVGRVDRLKVRDNITHWKAKMLDFKAILHRPDVGDEIPRYQVKSQVHAIDNVLDHTLVADAAPAIEKGKKVCNRYAIKNSNRTTGTILSYTIAKKYGLKGLADDTITCKFTGAAGQSFGAFLARGVTFDLTGDANDYVGKGLSGGKIIIRVPADAGFKPEDNVIVGNTVLYGATHGEAYFNGLAGERFCIRNSGAQVVVEGVGDHGCEYMTGGVVVVLGQTGVNFAAGMSGGYAYVYDPTNDFDLRCNEGQIDLEPVNEMDDIQTLHGMIERHAKYTGSARAKWMLQNWQEALPSFVKVFPIEYRRALGRMAKLELEARQTEAEKVELD